MHFDDTLIQAYLNDQPISKTSIYRMIEHYHKPDVKRRDVVRELNLQLHEITKQFPVFNEHLWSMLFHENSDILDTIYICPVVGSDTMSRTVTKDDQTYFLIDLIGVADVTRIVSQMIYILKNHITFEITKLCILKQYPMTSHHYGNMLDASAFINGLSYFLSWNESCELYQFHTDKYEPHKEKAFGLLAQALTIDNKALQHKILVHIHNGDLWEQFPAAAGMFYFNDIYRDLGENGIVQLYRMGPKDFVKHIFA